jgi:predicted nucleotidyltransferase
MSALQLETAAAILGPLLDEVVFVGGATVHLWLTEPGAPPARATEDVDVICEVATRVEYHRLGSRLRERGLREAFGEPAICRWKCTDPELVLDVMPTAPDILGFSNPWYEEAISTAATITLDSDAKIRAATPAVLVATKLCAWKGRGKGDLLRSLDVHDVLTLVDGRPELASEIEAAQSDLRTYLRDELVQLQAESYFNYAVDSATAGYGPLGADRASLVRERLHQLVLRC